MMDNGDESDSRGYQAPFITCLMDLVGKNFILNILNYVFNTGSPGLAKEDMV